MPPVISAVRPVNFCTAELRVRWVVTVTANTLELNGVGSSVNTYKASIP